MHSIDIQIFADKYGIYFVDLLLYTSDNRLIKNQDYFT
jgi:hypothetical protein